LQETSDKISLMLSKITHIKNQICTSFSNKFYRIIVEFVTI